MAFDNVTLLEINVEDVPLGASDERTADESAPAVRSEATDSADEAPSGGSAGRVVSYALAAVAVAGLAALAGWLLRRRGDQADDGVGEFETETVEPGVERVES